MEHKLSSTFSIPLFAVKKNQNKDEFLNVSQTVGFFPPHK